jgi:hypothetical protein
MFFLHRMDIKDAKEYDTISFKGYDSLATPPAIAP